MNLLAVDPGDKHVGMAYWFDLKFQDCWEIDPENFIPNLQRNHEIYDLIVYERFHLYPWLARTQSFSKMKTPQLIGQIELVATGLDIELHSQDPGIQRLIRETPYYKQHVEQHGKPSNAHAESALCHGLYWLYMNPKGQNLT